MSETSPVRATILATVFFAVSIGLGVVAVTRDPAAGEEIMALFAGQVAGQILSDSPAVLAGKLFLNNLSACLLLFLGGASLGVVTVLVLSVNGLLIGAVTEFVRQEQGLAFIAAALVPHGIFEIPAFLIAGGLGLLLGQELIAEWQGTGDAAARAVPLARLFLRVVVPLLAIAAVVEAFITPAILSMIA
ncbi:stage II sporulation protein M [Methanoculleus sp.]|uniref:stage II sporulation protein M n=1 Tax=Methanoculleus sp. TaxID=90427 RepID=UPI0025E953DA|nr:stage II sporulation protein M [Methanoculleus sp.]